MEETCGESGADSLMGLVDDEDEDDLMMMNHHSIMKSNFNNNEVEGNYKK
jgi:hypothetical protein